MYSSVSRQLPSPSATRSCNSGNYFSLRWLLSEKRNTSCVLPLDLDFLGPFAFLWNQSPLLSRDAAALYLWAGAAATKGGCSCSARTHFFAEGTTKENYKTSVIHRLTRLNVLWALVPPSFFRRKGKSFSPQISLTINTESTPVKPSGFALTLCCKTSDSLQRAPESSQPAPPSSWTC